MNLRAISDKALLQNTKSLVQNEREITLSILHHLREVERRSLYALLGYSSLFEYALRELRYSEGSAQRRISSMRLIKELPELEEKIESGVLSLTALSQAQVFFRQEGIRDEVQKKDVLLNLENKSKREIEKELVARSFEPTRLVQEKLRPVSPEYTEIKILVNGETMEQIEELRNLLSRSQHGITVREILQYALTETLNRELPKAPKSARARKAPMFLESVEVLTPDDPWASDTGLKPSTLVDKKPKPELPPPVAVAKSSRYISQNTKREVWYRDKGQCTYVETNSKKRCSCKYALEFDHITPHALGGSNLTDNLRLRCRAHNQLAAIETFGQSKMQNFVPRLR